MVIYSWKGKHYKKGEKKSPRDEGWGRFESIKYGFSCVSISSHEGSFGWRGGGILYSNHLFSNSFLKTGKKGLSGGPPSEPRKMCEEETRVKEEGVSKTVTPTLEGRPFQNLRR